MFDVTEKLNGFEFDSRSFFQPIVQRQSFLIESFHFSSRAVLLIIPRHNACVVHSIDSIGFFGAQACSCVHVCVCMWHNGLGQNTMKRKMGKKIPFHRTKQQQQQRREEFCSKAKERNNPNEKVCCENVFIHGIMELTTSHIVYRT